MPPPAAPYGDLTGWICVQKGNSYTIKLKKKKYVGIDMDLYTIIKSKAKKLNKSEDILINEWLSEKAST